MWCGATGDWSQLVTASKEMKSEGRGEQWRERERGKDRERDERGRG